MPRPPRTRLCRPSMRSSILLRRIRTRRYRSIIALLRPMAYDTVIRVRVAGWRRWRWREGRVGGAFDAGVVLADVFDDLAG